MLSVAEGLARCLCGTTFLSESRRLCVHRILDSKYTVTVEFEEMC